MTCKCDHPCADCAGEDHGAIEAQAAPPSPTTDAMPDAIAAARREGWREGMLAAADHLAAMWDDGDQTPEGFDPQKTSEVVLLRALAKETHR